MKHPLQIDFRDVPPLRSVEAAIRRRADQLDQWGPEVTSCHVAVESDGDRHRTGHTYRLHLRVCVPGGEIAVSSQPGDEDIHRAVRAAFDAASRQLEDRARRQRGAVKQHRLVHYGHIDALSDDGTGVILGEDGERYHFDRSHIVHPAFERLAVGQAVGFLEGLTRVGREARRIAPAHEPPTPEAAWT